MNIKKNGKPDGRFGWSGLVADAVITAVPVIMFYYTYTHYYHSATFYARGNYLFTMVYVLLLVLFMSMYGAYHIRQSRTRELVFSFGLAIVITNTVLYFVMCLISLRMVSPVAVLVTTILQWIVVLGLFVLFRIVLPKLEPEIPAVFVRGTEKEGHEIARKFDRRRTRYSFSASVSGDTPWPELKEALEPFGVIIIGRVADTTRRNIIGYCFRNGKKAILLPSMTDILVGSASSIIMSDTLLYDLNTQETDAVYQAAKRALDIVASALGLVVLSPLMLFAAAAVKLQDGGPVFYRQLRLTRGGRKFYLTKFRSMIVNAESGTGAVLAGKEDSRITPIGKFLRASRMDELPQLWNILRGDMTLVGPRPERPEFYEKICADYPEFDYRLKVKAGLTGYAQLYGKYNTTFQDKARLDMYYIQHASFFWDLQLIFYTLKIIFIRESTEGVDENQQSGDASAPNT